MAEGAEERGARTAAVLARSKLEWRRRAFGVGERIFCSKRDRARLRLMASMFGNDRSCGGERAMVGFARFDTEWLFAI